MLEIGVIHLLYQKVNKIFTIYFSKVDILFTRTRRNKCDSHHTPNHLFHSVIYSESFFHSVPIRKT